MFDIISEYWSVFLLSMMPIAELRGAIPAGIAMGLDPISVLIISIVGNMIPVPLIILFFRKIMGWMKTIGGLSAKIVHFLEQKADKSAQLVYKYELLGLCILVAIPLPGTGAWTGSLVAAVLNLRLKAAFPTILSGVCIAGILVLGVACGTSYLFFLF